MWFLAFVGVTGPGYRGTRKGICRMVASAARLLLCFYSVLHTCYVFLNSGFFGFFSFQTLWLDGVLCFYMIRVVSFLYYLVYVSAAQYAAKLYVSILKGTQWGGFGLIMAAISGIQCEIGSWKTQALSSDELQPVLFYRRPSHHKKAKVSCKYPNLSPNIPDIHTYFREQGEGTPILMYAELT